MSSNEPKRPWEDRLKQAGERAQDELHRVLRFIDDEVVPEVRRNGSSALRVAAEQMQKLADHLDAAHRADPSSSAGASRNTEPPRSEDEPSGGI